MEKEEKKFKGGAFLVARKIFEGELWLRKPSSWKIIWIYILGKVAHKDEGIFKRGRGFFNFVDCKEQIGNDITTDMIKKAMRYFKQNQMLSTRRSTKGMYIEVLNYNGYQTLSSFQSTDVSTSKALPKHSDTQEYKNIRKEQAETSSAKEQAETSSAFSKEGVEIIKLFEEIDSKNKNYYGNRTQRKACDFLTKQYGLEKVSKVIEYIKHCRGKPYFPSVTSPYELQEKWTKLAEFGLKERGEITSKSRGFI